MSKFAARYEVRQTNTNRKRTLTIAIITEILAAACGWAIAAQDKYAVEVPGGLAFSEFRGYESWQVVSVSQEILLLPLSPIL